MNDLPLLLQIKRMNKLPTRVSETLIQRLCRFMYSVTPFSPMLFPSCIAQLSLVVEDL